MTNAHRPLSYREAIGRLLGLTDFERAAGGGPRKKYDLHRMVALADRLGNPQDAIPTVHVTGTKGKGSVSAMLSAIGTAGGYRTGLYTSPHMHAYRERIQVDGTPVSEEAFGGLVNNLWPHVEALRKPDDEVTTFEMLTGMGFTHFREDGCGLTVIEVGLGGKLDATNVITAPKVCVITSISIDHAHILGNTVEEIAQDKAGIIKPGAVVVTAPQEPGAMAVIEAAARERKAKLIKVGTRFRWAFVDVNARGQVGILSNLDHEYRVELPLLGLHQLENAACAIAAAEALEQQGFDLTYDAILRGLAATSWPCRLDVLARSPLVVADGAHNPYAVKTVGASLELYLPHFRRVLIVGLTAGHDAEGIAAELARLEPMTVIATRTRHPRSLPAAQVAEMLRAHGLNVQEAADVPQALEKARGIAGKADMVLGIGSLFIAAEMREVMKGIPPEVYPEINVSKQTKGTV